MADLDLVLESFRALDYIYEPNVTALSEAFERFEGQREALVRISQFFVLRPEKARLINTPYFQHKYRGQVPFDVISMATDYSNGHLERAARTVRPHLSSKDCFFHLVLASIYRAIHDNDRERALLSEALHAFPNDPMVVLANVERHARIGDNKRANELLGQVKAFVCENLREEIEIVKQSAADLEEAIRTHRLSRSESFDLYTDEITRLTWLSYYERFATKSKYQAGDVSLRDFVNDRLIEFVHENGIKSLVDFGSLCAGLILDSALNCPETTFIGIDRQELVAKLNYEAYSYPNMKFESGDIMDYLPRFGTLAGPKLFFHVRTSCLLYPDQMIKIYKAAASAGVEYVMMAEGDGLSRDKLEYFDFDTMPAISIARKGVLLNHNYREILARAGYRIIAHEKLPGYTLWRDVSELVGAGNFIIAKFDPSLLS